MNNKKTFIKIAKEAKGTTIDSCEFVGDITHIDNEGKDTKLINNKHSLSKNSEEPPTDSPRITD